MGRRWVCVFGVWWVRACKAPSIGALVPVFIERCVRSGARQCVSARWGMPFSPSDCTGAPHRGDPVFELVRCPTSYISLDLSNGCAIATHQSFPIHLQPSTIALTNSPKGPFARPIHPLPWRITAYQSHPPTATIETHHLMTLVAHHASRVGPLRLPER